MGDDSQKDGVTSSSHRTRLFTLPPTAPPSPYSATALGSTLPPFFSRLLSRLSYHLSPPFPTSFLPSFALNGNHPLKVHFGLLPCIRA